MRFIPVIVSPCAWNAVPWLEPILARPRDGKALSGMSAHDADSALSELAIEVGGFLMQEPSALAAPKHLAVDYARSQLSRFAGRRISIDFKDGALEDVMRLFADIAGINIVVLPGLWPQITLKLNDVPWDQALHLLIRGHGWDYHLEDNVLTIGQQYQVANIRKP